MPLANPNAFSGNPLDRASISRKDPEWIAQQLVDPYAQMTVIWRGCPLVMFEADGKARILWMTPDAVSQFPRAGVPIFLGLKEGTPYFALDVSACGETPDTLPFADMGAYTSLREVAAAAPREDVAIVGQGAWLLDWHRRHQFCHISGKPTIFAEGGTKRIEPETGTEHFPRTDPVAIVLVVEGDACLLGRGPHFPEFMFSALAGFMEPGESLEECAAREVYEEAGVRLTDIDYQFSQPWPFPSSLMCGFIAQTNDRTLTLDTEEIAEARWVEKAEVKALCQGERREDLWLPPKLAIARQLMERWVQEERVIT